MTIRPLRLAPITALLLAGAAAHAADPLRMQTFPLYQGLSPSTTSYPVAVELENDGPDASGVVRVVTTGFTMDYPVELPRGSRKRLLTYPKLDWSGGQYLLITDQGRLQQSLSLPSSMVIEGGISLLMISDAPGDLAFLRTDANRGRRRDQLVMRDGYCKPNEAPTRPVGYSPVSVVVLGEGSERISDEAIEALKLWTLAGGILVFSGGASAPVLNDARWRDLLPVTGFETRSVAGSPYLSQAAGMPAPSFTIQSGRPISGVTSKSENGQTLTASRAFGLGQVHVMAFNLFEEPLASWEGRRSAFTKIVNPGDGIRGKQLLQPFLQESSSYSGGVGSPYASPSSPVAGAVREDPFSMRLPSTEKVFLILGAYFVAVIPLNFFVLRKLKRGELAWFTAPILSLGFAGALFNSAKELYGAKMSSAHQGIVIGREGMPEGIFVGKTQLFIPVGGSYDLGLRGVDSLGVEEDQYGYYRRRRDTGTMEPLDVGDVRVPNLRTNNLAFRKLVYRQRVPSGEWFSIEQSQDGQSYTVRNRSPYDVSDAFLRADAEIPLGSLASGATKTVKMTDALADSLSYRDQAFERLPASNAVALLGTINGFRPGPQLGQVVPGRSKIQLAYFAQEVAKS